MSDTTTGDLAKLTVPQLKVLCKERRILGYSKLGKAALLQRLTNNDAARRGDPQPVILIQPILETTAPEHTGHPTGLAPARSTGFAALNHTQIANKDLAVTSAEQSALRKVLPVSGPVDHSAASHHKSPMAVTSSSLDAPNESQSTKRARVSAMFESSKRQKPFPVNAASGCDDNTSSNSANSFPASGTRAQAVVTESPVVAGYLPHGSSASVSSNAVAIITQSRNIDLVQKGSTRKLQGRFKPLVFTTTPIVASTSLTSRRVSHNDHRADKITSTSSDTFSLEAAPISVPSLMNITFPPKLSERKRVQSWAVILAALTDRDRQTCTLVSRTFRYAAYLSAAHILTQQYHGRRLNQIMKCYPQNTTNMWPYLRQRQNEVAFWKHAFQNSFVGRYNSTLGIDPLSAHLWASVDDEKQVVVALSIKFRFVLTRLWFTLSVGTNQRDPSAWLKHTVEDAQEVVKGEIWAITIRDGNSLAEFYVLESTCEVIGRALNAPQLQVYSSGLRADWSRYYLCREIYGGAQPKGQARARDHDQLPFLDEILQPRWHMTRLVSRREF
ncbi:hypothetical protein EDD22DRAFT_820186 [Suillus occidentalis]|nr:hypothetical protein EDD22DRAFT_820186 [Suillus occidentalis]